MKPEEPEIGRSYWVKLRDDSWHGAEIVQIRSVHGANANQYYVHFKGLNRRFDEWIHKSRINLEKTYTDVSEEDESRKFTRNLKRRHDEMQHGGAHAELDPVEKEYEALTSVKFISTVQLGRYEIDAWYYSPYPDSNISSATDKLWVCEYCLKYMRREDTYRYHLYACKARQPPGQCEIYRHDTLSVYEIDGRDHKLYSQNLCLLAKLFLDHKTLYWDVEPFLFYVLCEVDRSGAHLVGYFSKERSSPEHNTLACILVFPPFQRKGYGRFLIDLSYELAAREGIIGSPEKPLSDLGRRSFRSHWAYLIVNALQHCKESSLSVAQIVEATGIATCDVVASLHALNLVKYWRGQHVICVSPKVLSQLITLVKPPRITLNKEGLRWGPASKS